MHVITFVWPYLATYNVKASVKVNNYLTFVFKYFFLFAKLAINICILHLCYYFRLLITY